MACKVNALCPLYIRRIRSKVQHAAVMGGAQGHYGYSYYIALDTIERNSHTMCKLIDNFPICRVVCALQLALLQR